MFCYNYLKYSTSTMGKQRRKLTQEQEQLLRELAPISTISEIANRLGVSYISAYWYCKNRNIKVPVKSYRKWSEDEVQMMEILRPKEVAQRLGVPSKIVHQRKRTALAKGQIQNNWKNLETNISVSDDIVDEIEQSYCVKCQHDNSQNTCSILNLAYQNKLPKEWQLDSQRCTKFEQK